MRIVIGGGGKVAHFLIGVLLENQHEITLIEEDKALCSVFANRFAPDLTVVHGDGTDLNILAKAGCQKADYFIAVTGQDETNLVACQLAKRDFEVRTTIARANNPYNADFFKQSGVDMVYSGTQLVADIIEQDIDYENMSVAYGIKGTDKNIVELSLNPRSKAVGKRLDQYRFPGESRLVLVTRGDETIIPTGQTQLEAADVLLVLCSTDDYEEIYTKLVEP